MWNLLDANLSPTMHEAPAYYRDLISEMYDTSWYGGLAEAELAYYQNFMQGRRALEFPVGTGRLAIPLLEAGVDLYGLDNSTAMLSQLTEKLARHGLTAEQHRFILWGALNTPYPCPDATFDVAAIAFASFSLMHSNMTGEVGENRVMRELNRVLRMDGTLMINDYRTTRIAYDRLNRPHVFNHRHSHPVHGDILEEQISDFKVEPNRLLPNQVVRYRRNRLVRVSDGTVLQQGSEITPIWDVDGFRALGRDAGFDYVVGEVVQFYTDETINHVFVKRKDLEAARTRPGHRRGTTQ